MSPGPRSGVRERRPADQPPRHRKASGLTRHATPMLFTLDGRRLPSRPYGDVLAAVARLAAVLRAAGGMSGGPRGLLSLEFAKLGGRFLGRLAQRSGVGAVGTLVPGLRPRPSLTWRISRSSSRPRMPPNSDLRRE